VDSAAADSRHCTHHPDSGPADSRKPFSLSLSLSFFLSRSRAPMMFRTLDSSVSPTIAAGTAAAGVMLDGRGRQPAELVPTRTTGSSEALPQTTVSPSGPMLELGTAAISDGGVVGSMSSMNSPLLPPDIDALLDGGSMGFDVGIDSLDVDMLGSPAAQGSLPSPTGRPASPGALGLSPRFEDLDMDDTALFDFGQSESAALLDSNSGALALQSVLPGSGTRMSPLKQYQMMSPTPGRSASFGLPPRFTAPLSGVGGSAEASGSEIVQYNPAAAAAAASAAEVMPRFKLEPLDPHTAGELPALEYGNWGAAEREAVKVAPPDSMDTITDMQLAYIDLKDLHRLMAEARYTPEQIKDTKLKRRRLKNRNSAKGSATKRKTQMNSQKTTNERLAQVVTDLQNQNEKLVGVNAKLLAQTEEARRVAAAAVAEREHFQRELQRMSAMLQSMSASTNATHTARLSSSERPEYIE